MNPQLPIIFEGAQPGSLQESSFNVMMTQIDILARRWHNLQDRKTYRTQGDYIYRELRARHPSVDPVFVQEVYKEWRRRNPKKKKTSPVTDKKPHKKEPPGGPSGRFNPYSLTIR